MQQWGVNSASDLEYKQGSTQKQEVLVLLLSIFMPPLQKEIGRILCSYIKKEECWGWDKAPKQMPFIFLFSSQQLNANRETPDVCVTTFKLKVCLILVFFSFFFPFPDNTRTCQSPDKGSITRWKRQCYACCCTVVIKPQHSHFYALFCFLFFWKVFATTSQLLATPGNFKLCLATLQFITK